MNGLRSLSYAEERTRRSFEAAANGITKEKRERFSARSLTTMASLRSENAFKLIEPEFEVVTDMSVVSTEWLTWRRRRHVRGSEAFTRAINARVRASNPVLGRQPPALCRVPATRSRISAATRGARNPV